jgi:plasmid maintenance system antidote protein VapI
LTLTTYAVAFRMLSLDEQLRAAIRAAIKSKDGPTEHGLAMAAGVSPPILHRFMHSERTLTLETADKLCRFLGLSLKR